MSASLLTYAPEDVTILISGHRVTGVESIELEWLSKPFKMIQGIRGGNTRIFDSNMGAVLHLDILQTSETNDILSTILFSDQTKRSARCEMSFFDKSGSTRFSSVQAYVPMYPTTKFSNGLEVRQWQLDILRIDSVNIGGNNIQGFDIFSSIQGAVDYLSAEAGEVVNSVSSTVSNIRFG